MYSDNVAADDLTRIGGIGPAYRDALHAVGIRRFADLARFSTASELQQVLEEQAEVNIPVWKIDKNDWLGQARALNDQTVDEQEAVFEADSAGDEVPPSRRWRQHAGFSVFFDQLEETDGEHASGWQTRVYHDESGEENVFTSVDVERWMAWVLEKARLPETDPAELVFVAPQTTEAPQTVEVLKIISVEVSESRPTYGVLEGTLSTAVRFRVAEETAVDARAPFRLEVYLVELDEQTTDLVASIEGRLEPGQEEYLVQAEFPFPDAGRYRLSCVIFLLPPASGFDVHEENVLNFVSHEG